MVKWFKILGFEVPIATGPLLENGGQVNQLVGKNDLSNTTKNVRIKVTEKAFPRTYRIPID